jgi:ankyrin repeat protein
MDQSLDAAEQGSIDALYQSFRDAAEQGSIDALYQSFKAAEQRRTDVLCQSLRDAAEQGSIDALYALIRTNADVLDSMDKIPIVETPLHIAASLGHTEFAMEIMKLKPSFARKLNQDGFTPMHLALQKLHELENDDALQRNLTQLVHQLLDVEKDLVRVKGREGVTPLHYVAQIGNLNFLAKFFEACPESLEDVTIRGENVLHIALKYDMVEAFWLLIRWLRRAWFKDAKLLEEKLLNWQDDEGNTLLHVAVSRNQPEASLKFL